MFKKSHPSRAELFEHVESLLAKKVRFNSPVMRHVATCQACSDEIAAIRDSLHLVHSADALDPTKDLQAAILLAAKSEQGSPLGLRPPRFSTVSKAFALTAVVGLVAAVLLRTDPVEEATEPAGLVAQPTLSPSIGSHAALSSATPEERLLGTALMSSQWSPANRWEMEQRRALDTMDSDIKEALEALKNNPALVRASLVVATNRERKKETLKTLYVNRDL